MNENYNIEEIKDKLNKVNEKAKEILKILESIECVPSSMTCKECPCYNKRGFCEKSEWLQYYAEGLIIYE